MGIVLVLAAALSATAGAQSDRQRSATGRHRPRPQPQAVSDSTASESTAGATSGWFVGLGVGMSGGGDLWRVETVNAASIPWLSAVPFSSSHFNATLSNNLGGGIFVGRRLGGLWSLRLDLNTARMDVFAEAPRGQLGGVFGYDRLTMSTLVVSGEAKLARIPSAPYVNLGVVTNRVTAAREVELNQTQIGYRLGLGYLKVLSPELSLRIETRYSRFEFDTGAFVPQSTFPTQPELKLKSASDLNLFEIVFAVQLNL